MMKIFNTMKNEKSFKKKRPITVEINKFIPKRSERTYNLIE